MRLRPPPKDLALLAVLCMMLVWLVMIGAQAPARRAVTPDSSAVVMWAENRTAVPVEVFLKHDGTYDRQGACPPASRCIYVLPSDRLTAVDSFQIACLGQGETEPHDSPPYRRKPGELNVPACVLQAGTAEKQGVSRAIFHIY